MKTVFDYHHNILSKFTFLEVIFVLISFIGDSCQYWMDLENQKLSSPYYPQKYFSDGIGCEWLITAPEGHIISLEFDHFNVSKNLISKQKFRLSVMIYFLVGSQYDSYFV